MHFYRSAILSLGVLAGLICLGIVVWLFASGRFSRLSRPFVGAAVSPSLIMMALIASLAVHMYFSLGGRPQRIGNEGFSSGLLFHSSTTIYFFVFLLYVTMFVWPMAVFVCALVTGWRRALPYLALYHVAHCCIWAMLYIMPKGFKYWWWD